MYLLCEFLFNLNGVYNTVYAYGLNLVVSNFKLNYVSYFIVAYSTKVTNIGLT